MSESGLPESIRTFVAIELPGVVLRALQSMQDHLKATLPEKAVRAVRWAAGEQMHLTLKFLGKLAVADLPGLQIILESICKNSAPLKLRVEGLGCFPSFARPRVIWVGLKGEMERLMKLQAAIEAATGTWAERETHRIFHPHVTLGRVKELSPRAGRQIGKTIKEAPAQKLAEWNVQQIRLMRSILGPQGAKHVEVACWHLGTADH